MRTCVVLLAVAAVFGVVLSSVDAVTTSDEAHGASLPPGFVEEDVVNGLSAPVSMAWLPDGRFLVGEKSGRLKMVDPATGQVTATLLDMRDEVNTYNDRGFLGLAVHPDFPADDRVFFLYTYDPPEAADPSAYWDGNSNSNRQFSYGQRDGRGHRVSRLESLRLDSATNFTTVVAGSRTVVLGTNSVWDNIGDPFSWQADTSRPWTCADYQPGDDIDEGTPIEDCIPADGGSHSIGTLRFAPDGSLYAGMGDAASYNGVDQRAIRSLQDDWLVGKIVKLDPDTGHGVPGNPNYNGDGSDNASRMFHAGLRNPFRFSIDPSTGWPVSGDVGWGRFEELNTGPPGSSFGWPCFEGGLSDATMNAGTHEGPGINRVQPSYTNLADCNAYPSATQDAPTWTWCRGGAGAGCPGGSHSAMGGTFYEGDTYPPGYRDLWYGDVSKKWIKVLDLSNPIAPVTVTTDTETVVDMSIGPETNVYYVDIGIGVVRRVRYVGGGNVQPVAVATSDVTDGFAPLTVSFDGTDSYDPDAEPLQYDWDFGDGATAMGATVSHTYTTSGEFTATLTVTDGSNATDVDTIDITVGNSAPTATITSPAGDIIADLGTSLSFTGTGTDPEDGTLTGASLSWTGELYHGGDHTHPDVYTGTGTNPPSTILTDHDDDTYLEICLTATDSGGLSDTDCVNIRPTEVDYTFVSDPAGLDLVYNGSQQTAPFTVTTPVGGARQISAPLSQGGLNFDMWSIGGPADQTITIGGTDLTVTAFYTGDPLPVVTPRSASVLEGDEPGSVVVDVPVTLSAQSATPVTVEWTTLDTGEPGIATEGVDYVAASGTVTFDPGEVSETVSITVLGDSIDEPPLLGGEWLLLQFSDPSPNALLDLSFFGLGLGIIVDDDPTPVISPGLGSVVEGDEPGTVQLDVPVTLSGPSAVPVTVEWTTLDTGEPGIATEGVDYVAASGTVTFDPGEVSETVSITVLGDSIDEPPLLGGEWLWVVFSEPSPSAVLDLSFFGLGLGIIIDDDA